MSLELNLCFYSGNQVVIPLWLSALHCASKYSGQVCGTRYWIKILNSVLLQYYTQYFYFLDTRASSGHNIFPTRLLISWEGSSVIFLLRVKYFLMNGLHNVEPWCIFKKWCFFQGNKVILGSSSALAQCKLNLFPRRLSAGWHVISLLLTQSKWKYSRVREGHSAYNRWTKKYI